MTKAEVRQFARFYYREFKRDYPDIYADDAAWAAWSRMLIASEEAWPAMPELPRWLKPRVLRILTDRGLIKVTGSTFILKGWVTDRAKRQKAASNAAAQRWHSDGNADAHADAGADALLDRERGRKREGEQGVRALDGGRLTGPVDPGRKTA